METFTGIDDGNYACALNSLAPICIPSAASAVPFIRGRTMQLQRQATSVFKKEKDTMDKCQS